MIGAPGQGFRTGLYIQFVAIPYPLPDELSADLIKAGTAAVAARKSAELLKDSENAKRAKAEQKHMAAMADLESTEISIRHAAGVVHTRPRFLSATEDKHYGIG